MHPKRSLLAATIVAGLLLPAAVSAAPVEQRVATLVVRYEAIASTPMRALLRAQVGATVTGSIPELALERVEVSTAHIEALRSSPFVSSAELDRELRVMGNVPDDPLLRLQWPLRKLDAFKAWKHEDPKA